MMSSAPSGFEWTVGVQAIYLPNRRDCYTHVRSHSLFSITEDP